MEPFVQRLLTEQSELKDKITKLDDFVNTEAFDNLEKIQRTLLISQCAHMKAYLRMLDLRLLHLGH